MKNHYRRLETMYHQAPCNQIYQPTLRVGEGTAHLEFDIKEEFFHALGAVHGSIYFKALDDAAYFAVASLVEDVAVLTTSFHLHLLRPVVEGRLRAEGRVVRRSRSLSVAEAQLFDESGKELARGSGDFMPSKIVLAEVPGYKL